MRMRSLFVLLLIAGCSKPADSSQPDPATATADPLIGTAGTGFNIGSSFPGAVAPQGLAKIGPDTTGPILTGARHLHCAGYWYGDDTIQGFSSLHLHGTGVPDYGVLALMPTDSFDASRTLKDGYQSSFKKSSEHASPGYYAVTLDRGNIAVELTATAHAGRHRYTYPDSATTAHVVFDLAHALDEGKIPSADFQLYPSEHRIRGKLRSMGDMSSGFGGYEVYFEARTRQSWRAQQVWSDGGPPVDGMQASGMGVGFELEFDLTKDRSPVEIQLGLSLVSGDGAAANLTSEMASLSFDDTRARTRAAWEQLIDSIHVQGGTRVERRKFLTAMYHAFLMPTIESDIDGSYVGADQKVHPSAGFNYCSDMSLWDTYRTLHPLYHLIAPDRALDAVRSLVEMAKRGGAFPKWPLADGDTGSMIGASAEVVIADAYLKGLRGFDAQGAYTLLRAAAMDATDPPGGRGGRNNVAAYMQYGYVPDSVGGSVSWTTEYGRDDFALSNLAAALDQAQDAQALLARSTGYRKLFDPATGFLRARRKDGSLPPGSFDPTLMSDDFVEANAWQSLWMDNYDVDGLASLFGGRAQLIDKLTSMFESAKAEWDSIGPKDMVQKALPRPFYWAGNEPDIHAVYLFAQAGRPDLTQRWIKWLMASFYSDQPDGLPGNDDGGTMSAWYVFGAIGLYPLPGSDRYIVGAPAFPHLELRVAGGVFTIDAPGLSGDNIYVQSVQLNGVPLMQPELRHADLRAGGTLQFTMGPSPSRWGQSL